MSAALKLMENRRIFIESLCRNSHTGITGMAESGTALISREKIKEVRACVIFIFEESLD